MMKNDERNANINYLHWLVGNFSLTVYKAIAKQEKENLGDKILKIYLWHTTKN